MKILVLNCGSSSLKYQLFALEEEKNLDSTVEGIISRQAKVQVLVVPTDEEKMIAQETWTVLQKQAL